MKILQTITIAAFCGMFVRAQERQVLTFNDYLNNVKKSNITCLAEKYSIDIAEANLRAARVFPDPELSVSYENNQNWNLQMGYSVSAELSYTLELGGKRRARIRVAQSEKELTGALLEDFFRNLHADATIAYLTALKQQRICEIQSSSYQRMRSLALSDSIRFRLGAIPEVDARQSKLQAAAQLNDLYASRGDLQEIMLQLLLLQGHNHTDVPDSIAGELSYPQQDIDLSVLVATAQNNRADLQAALKSKELSQNNLHLAKANRIIDLGLNIGGGYSSQVLNEIAPAPAFNGITAGITIPLKFSNANNSALRAARLVALQSEKHYEAIEQQITSEVTRAYNRYKTACLQVEHFNTGILNEAETILEKKIYSYERGETAILEVLNAQRTCNDTQAIYV